MPGEYAKKVQLPGLAQHQLLGLKVIFFTVVELFLGETGSDTEQWYSINQNSQTLYQEHQHASIVLVNILGCQRQHFAQNTDKTSQNCQHGCRLSVTAESRPTADFFGSHRLSKIKITIKSSLITSSNHRIVLRLPQIKHVMPQLAFTSESQH